MQEITRIHIAKVSYDIEVVAKKELKKYLRALRAYAHDDEVYQDIEIRVTELLGERGVQKDGVISLQDVEAVREQLGEPKDFADGDDEAAVEVAGSKKLYRNGDDAMVAGVLSGIAAYFAVDAVWVRLAFIALLFISLGTALLVYVLLWIVVPEAKTSTEKLAMRGQAVTLQTLRDAAERSDDSESTGQRRTRFIGKIVAILVGVGALCTAIVALGVTIFTPIAVLRDGWFEEFTANGLMHSALWLGVASGVLFVLLCLLVAYMAFTRTVARRTVAAAVAVVVLGLTTVGLAGGMALYESVQRDATIRQLVTTRTVQLPAGSTAIQELRVSDVVGNVRYEVSSQTRAELRSLPGVTANVAVNDGVMHVTVEAGEGENEWGLYDWTPELTIYGPALAAVVSDASTVEYVGGAQESLRAEAKQGGSLELSGSVTTANILAAADARVNGAGAALDVVDATVESASTVELGTVGTLQVRYDSVCPAMSSFTVTFAGSRSQTMRLNDIEQVAASAELACGKVVWERED